MEIQVILRNVSPIFSAAPGANTIALNGTINPPQGGFPLTRQRTLKVAAETPEGAIKPVYVPVVPGNTMRNLLRRTMLEKLILPCFDDGQQVGIGAYAAMYSGNATGNPEGAPSTFDEVVTMRSHPFIGLFGGGPRMLEGRLMVDSMFPIHMNSLRVIGPGHESRMISGNITDVVWTRRVDPILKMNETDGASVIKGGASAANQWITDLLESNKAKSAKKKAKDEPDEASFDDVKVARGLNAFNAHEVVVPGVQWVWRIAVDQPTEAQVGMILSAISHIQSARVAGGHAKDYGRVVIEEVELDGQSVWSGTQLDESTGGYMDALASAMDELDIASFDQFVATGS